MTNVLMVCMGNICRSPMAMVVAQALADKEGGAVGPEVPTGRIRFDAAGTHAHHVGEKPDSRATAALVRRGYQAGKMRSRRIAARDFDRFDLILAMDNINFAYLTRLCPPHHLHKVRRFLDFCPDLLERDVPDPYYGNVAGFEKVLDLCEAGANGLLSALFEKSQRAV